MFLCLLSHYIERHMRKALAFILFEEHDADGKPMADADPVRPAESSEAIRPKVETKRTDSNFPVYSFKTLLADLATVTLNTVATPKGGTFPMLSSPTPLQSKTFELLGLRSKELFVAEPCNRPLTISYQRLFQNSQARVIFDRTRELFPVR